MQDYIFELKTNGFTFPAVALWNSGLGFYCGYVGIDETNGCYQNDHDNHQMPAVVHGGITFNGAFEALDNALKFVDFSNCEAETVQTMTTDFLVKKNKFKLEDNFQAKSTSYQNHDNAPSIRRCSTLIPHNATTCRPRLRHANDSGEKFSVNLDWIGFDCGHHSDKSLLNPNGKERDVDFVLHNLKLMAKIFAGSSYEIYMRRKQPVKISVTEKEHNEMMVLAITGDIWAKKYIQDLKVSN